MPTAHKSSSPKRATNVSLRSDLIAEARRLNVNISQACEQGLEQQVARTRADRWREENKAAIDYWNEWVEKNGLPLDEHRQF